MHTNDNFCNNCGSSLNEGDRFCANCGAIINNQVTINKNQFLSQNNNTFFPNMSTDTESQTANQHSDNTFNHNFYNQVNNDFNNNQNTISKQNSNSNWKFVVFGIVLIALACGIVNYISKTYYKNLDNTDNNSSNYSNVEKNNNSNNDKLNNNSTNNSTTNNQNLSQSISFKGYTILAPKDYYYEIDETSITLSDDKNKWSWYSVIQVVVSDFNRLITNKNQVISSMETLGYKVNAYNKKTYYDIQCIAMEIEEGQNKGLIGYMKIDSSKTFVISVMTINNNYDYNKFAEIVKILKTGL